jgi:hypothetical protein
MLQNAFAQPRNLFTRALLWSCAALVVIIAIAETRPPGPKSRDAASDQFSSARAIAHLPHVASQPHVVGSSENERVCDYLVQVLRDLGGNPHVETTIGVLPRGRRIYSGTAHNIVAVFPGAANSRSVMLVAHYDSGERGPGAADDGLGVIVVLEAVRAVRASTQLKNDLIVLFTDGEEAGLLGASGYVKDHPDLFSRVGLVLNLEARGSSGPVYMFETSEKNGWLMDEFARVPVRPLASSIMYSFYKQLPNDTDMTVFKKSGLIGFNFAVIGSHENYHTRLDTVQNLDPSSVQQMGSSALALAEHFGNLELQDLHKPDNVYFNWLGTRLIHYPPGVAHVLLFSGMTLLTTLVILACHRQLATPKWIALSAGGALLLFAAVTATAEAGWEIVNLLTRGALLFGDTRSNYLLLLAILLASLASGLFVFGWLISRTGAVNTVLGQMVVLAILAIVTNRLLPGANYIFEWPLILGLLGTCALVWEWRAVCGFLVSVPALLIISPMIPQMLVSFDMTTLAVTATAILIALLLVATSTLLVHIVNPRRSVVCGLLSLSFVCLVPGVCLSHFSPIHPQHNTLLYALNTDLGDAAWISFDTGVDAWTSQFLENKPERTSNPLLLLGRETPVLMRKAPLAPLPAPWAVVVRDEKDGDNRLLKLHLSTPRRANALEMRLPGDIGLESLAWNDRKISLLSEEGLSTPWVLRYANVPREGVDLELSLCSQSAFKLWLGDISYGLPQFPDLRYEQRPDSMMAWWDSDVTLVGRQYEF